MHMHPETYVELDRVGIAIPPYRPTVDLENGFIDSSHRQFATCPVKDNILIQMKNRRWFGTTIPGWLRREDALKLYEMSYFAAGDILELAAIKA